MGPSDAALSAGGTVISSLRIIPETDNKNMYTPYKLLTPLKTGPTCPKGNFILQPQELISFTGVARTRKQNINVKHQPLICNFLVRFGDANRSLIYYKLIQTGINWVLSCSKLHQSYTLQRLTSCNVQVQMLKQKSSRNH